MKIIITVGYYKSRTICVMPDELIRYVELLEQAFPGEWAISSPPEGSAGEPDGECAELPVEESYD